MDANNDEDIVRHGDLFNLRSKYVRGRLPAHRLDFSKKPPEFKAYTDPVKRVMLPTEFTLKEDSLMATLRGRESRRSFSREPVELQEVSTLLKFTSGLKGGFTPRGFNKRHVPSAGGLFPYETYVIANNVSDIEAGLYHYEITSHSIDLLQQGSLGAVIAAGALDQQMAATAAVVLAWSAVVPRSKWKYLQRGYRYIYLDLGHVGQNFYLVSDALGLFSRLNRLSAVSCPIVSRWLINLLLHKANHSSDLSEPIFKNPYR